MEESLTYKSFPNETLLRVWEEKSFVSESVSLMDIDGEGKVWFFCFVIIVAGNNVIPLQQFML